MTPALRIAFLKAVSEWLEREYKTARAAQAEAMAMGDTLAARDPVTNRKLGTVNLSDPESIVEVHDERALADWMAERYPELTEPVTEIAATDSMVKQVLFQYAPEYLRHTRRVRPADLIELKSAAKTLGSVVGPGGETDLPGISVRPGRSTVSCRLTDDALPVLLDLYRQGRIEIDGFPRPVIEESPRDRATD